MPEILNAECKSAGLRVSQVVEGTDRGQSRTDYRGGKKIVSFIIGLKGF